MMEMAIEQAPRRHNVPRYIKGSLAALAFLAASCTSSEAPGQAESSTAPATASDEADAGSSAVSDTVQVVFTDLGGGSDKINVYRGRDNTADDRIVTNTYEDGDPAEAFCWELGRTVVSHPELGELPVEDDRWALLDTSLNANPSPEWATYTYLDPKSASTLENCRDLGIK